MILTGPIPYWELGEIDKYPNCEVKVFNKWGQVVFSSIGYELAWDGTYDGEELPVGTYYYYIDLKDGSKPVSGYVTLIK